MAFNYRVGDEPVPGFRLERFLGRGAIGEVWKAVGPGGTEASLKIIDLSGSGIHGRKEFRALQLVKRIHHPNLTPIIGLWAKGDDGAILAESDTVQLEASQSRPAPKSISKTMMTPEEPMPRRPAELIIAMGLGRQSLADRLADCQAQGMEGIPLEELLCYMEDAAEAIDFLNSAIHELESGTGAIVHCDIKPLNILVVGGAVQVCDFGLAHMVGKARRTVAAMGTIAYAAPELLEGKPSATTDQYCLAVTYVELRTGALPYDDESSVSVLSAVRDGNLYLAKLPEPERQVIRKATSTNPADRYASATEMVRALRAAALGDAEGKGTRKAETRVFVKMLAALAVVAAIVLAAYRLLPGPKGPTADDLVARADEHFRGGDFQSAIGDYTSALTLDDGSAGALLGRGRSFTELREYPQAIADLKRARELDPNNSDIADALVRAYRATGEAHFQRKDYPRAISDLEQSLALDPQNASAGRTLSEAYVLQAESLLKAGQWESARQLLSQALARFPNDPKLLTQMGQAFAGLDLIDDALKPLNAAVQFAPRNPDAHFYRGLAETKKGQFEPAIRDFEMLSRELDPENALGYKSRKEYSDAYLGLATKFGNEAKELFNKAGASRDEAVRKKGQAKLNDAIAQLAKGIEHDPNRAILWSRRGVFRRYASDFPGAIADLSQAIQLAGNDVDKDLVFRGEVYQRMASLADKPERKAELLSDARKDFASASQKNPKNADAHYLLAVVSSQQDDYRAAVDAYSKAIDAHPHWRDPWFTLSEAYYGRGNCLILTRQIKEASEDFRRVLESKDPLPAERGELAEILHELAKEFWQAKQPAEARKWLQKALELAPDGAAKEKLLAVQNSWKDVK